MAKGALAIGVGAALLLGGGGTLAVWNDTETAAAGQIASGDLQLNTTQAGTWTNLAGTKVDLAKYKVVPGDVLTYTQTMDVKLVGDLMAAKLTVTDPALSNGGFLAADVEMQQPTVMKGNKNIVGATLIPADSGTVTASAKFTFKHRDGQGQSSTNVSAAFSEVQFKLDQVAPTGK